MGYMAHKRRTPYITLLAVGGRYVTLMSNLCILATFLATYEYAAALNSYSSSVIIAKVKTFVEFVLFCFIHKVNLIYVFDESDVNLL